MHAIHRPNDRADMPAIYRRWYRTTTYTDKNNHAYVPTIYRLTNRRALRSTHYHDLTLAPYCYYNRPLLPCLQLIDHLLLRLQPTDIYCFHLQLIDHLLLRLQPTDPCYSTCS